MNVEEKINEHLDKYHPETENIVFELLRISENELLLDFVHKYNTVIFSNENIEPINICDHQLEIIVDPKTTAYKEKEISYCAKCKLPLLKKGKLIIEIAERIEELNEIETKYRLIREFRNGNFTYYI